MTSQNSLPPQDISVQDSTQSTTSHNRFRTTWRNTLWGKIILILLVLVLLFFTVDTIMGSTVERRISKNLNSHSSLEVPPTVVLGSTPVASSLFTHKVNYIDVGATDAYIAPFGLVGLKSSAEKITLTEKQSLWDGNILGAQAEKIISELSLDVVALGQLMDIPDLHLQNADDISPRGGWETEAIMIGTHPDSTSKSGQESTVKVALRIHNGDVTITPTEIQKTTYWETVSGSIMTNTLSGDQLTEEYLNDNPHEQHWVDKVFKTFSLTIPRSDIPLSGPPIRVFTSGGSLGIMSEKYYSPITFDDLLPGVRTTAH